ncbi:unnamed protein product [Amoebophrya sp. A120]|nr:unnamed protein product [Amoebophrya sp. A120]|eukprot:GSA120T00003051001.1
MRIFIPICSRERLRRCTSRTGNEAKKMTRCSALLRLLLLASQHSSCVGLGAGRPSSEPLVQSGESQGRGVTNANLLPVHGTVPNNLRWKQEFNQTLAAYGPETLANFYFDSKSFSTFNGYDFIPEHESTYAESWKWSGMNFVSGKGLLSPGPRIVRSTASGDKKSKKRTSGYVRDVIGPFFSRGGHDWWQLHVNDIAGLGGLAEKHEGGIGVTEYGVAPIAASTKEVLGNPPIQIHHAHAVHGPNMRHRMPDYPSCNPKGDTNRNKCYDWSAVFEWHGDYECPKKLGGLNCFHEKAGTGFVKQVHGPLDFEVDMNDVRAITTEYLAWYLQVTVKWVALKSFASLKPLSQKFLIGPGNWKLSDQLSYQNVFSVPAKEDSMHIYTGRYTFTGDLIRNKFHCHNPTFHSSYFLHDCSPEDLGLSKDLLSNIWTNNGNSPAEPIGSVTEIRSLLLTKAAYFGAKAGSRCKIACTAIGRPELVKGPQHLKDFKGQYLSVRAPLTTCDATHLQENQQYTVVTLHEKRNPRLLPPAFQGMEKLPSHAHWILQYYDTDNPTRSSYSYRIHSEDVNSFLDSQQLGFHPRLVLTWWYDTSFPGTSMRGNYLTVAFAVVAFAVLVILRLMWLSQFSGTVWSRKKEDDEISSHKNLAYQALVGKISKDFLNMNTTKYAKIAPDAEEDEAVTSPSDKSKESVAVVETRQQKTRARNTTK